MRSTRLSRGIAAAALACAMAFGLAGCNQERTVRVSFLLERAPKEYRQCRDQVEPTLPKEIPWKDVPVYLAEFKKYGRDQNRCVRGLINWADAQYAAYAKAYRAR